MTFRKLIFENQTWRYYIGKINVAIKTPDGKKVVAKIWEVKGTTPDIVERGQWKKTFDGMIMPSDVRRFIEFSILKRDPPKKKLRIPTRFSSSLKSRVP